MLLHATDSRRDVMFLPAGVETWLLPSLLFYAYIWNSNGHSVLPYNFLSDFEGDHV